MNAHMWLAWNIDSDEVAWPPPSVEEKVDIFYQRSLGWQLHIADMLANGGQPLGRNHSVERVEHSGFAVLQICLSYFETVGHYEKGCIGSGAFKEGVRSV